MGGGGRGESIKVGAGRFDGPLVLSFSLSFSYGPPKQTGLWMVSPPSLWEIDEHGLAV